MASKKIRLSEMLVKAANPEERLSRNTMKKMIVALLIIECIKQNKLEE
jgi:hypothetical protein